MVEEEVSSLDLAALSIADPFSVVPCRPFIELADQPQAYDHPQWDEGDHEERD